MEDVRPVLMYEDAGIVVTIVSVAGYMRTRDR